MRVVRLVTCVAACVALVVPVATAAAFEATPVVSVGSGAVVEGQIGGRYIAFTVSLSWRSTETVTVLATTVDSTATAPADYRAKSRLLTFRPGVTGRYFAVRVNEDMQVEDDETFLVVLSEPTNAVLGNDTGVGTIIDDDPNVGARVNVGDITVYETCDGRPVRAHVPLDLSVRKGTPVTVHAQSSGISATHGLDHLDVARTLTFTAGQTVKRLPVRILPDVLAEADETIQVDLTLVSGDALVGRAVGTITVVDCTPPD